MANFVESATLKLIDQATAPANRINAALRRLQATADSIGRNTTGLDNLKRKLDALNQASAKQLRVTADTTQAQRNLESLRRSMDALNRANKRAAISGLAASAIAANAKGGSPAAAAVAAALGGRQGTSKVADAIQRAQDNFIRDFERANGRAPSWVNPKLTGSQSTGGVAARFASAATTAGRVAASPLPDPATLGTIAKIAAAAAVYKVASIGVSGLLAEDDAKFRLRQSGNTEAEVARKLAFARELSTGPFRGVSAGQILDSSLEAANQAFNTTDVKAQMALVARNAQILAMTFKDTAKGAEEARQLSRVLNLAGVGLDPVKGQEFGDQIMKAIIAGGGDVTAQDTRRMLQQLKAARIGLSARGIGDLISLRDEGGRQGTADARMFIQELTRANLNKRDKALQIAAGFRDADGTTKLDVAKALKDNPIDFILDQIVPKLRKMGANLDDAAEVAAAGRKLGFGESAVTLLQQVTTQREQIEADRRSRRRVNLESALGDDTSIRGRMARLEAQVQNAAGVATEGLVAPAGRAMRGVEDRLAEITKRGGTPDTADIAAVAGGFALAMLPKLISEINPKDPMSVAALTLVGAGIALTTAASALLKFAGVDNPFNLGDGKTAAERATEARNAEIATLRARAEQIDQKIAKERRLPIEMRDSMIRERDAARAKITALEAEGNAAARVETERKLREKIGSPDRATSLANTALADRAEIDKQLARNLAELNSTGKGAPSEERKAELKEGIERLTRERNLANTLAEQALARSAEAAVLGALDRAQARIRRENGDAREPLAPAPRPQSGDEIRAPLLQNDTRADKLAEAFGLLGANNATLADRLQTAGDSINNATTALPAALVAAGAETGATIAGGLQSQASAIGNSIGAAAAAQLQGVTLNVTATAAPAANTGTQAPR